MPQHRNIENKTYNERLFSPGLRGFLHNARFKWSNHCFVKYNINKGSVLEIGCNDGRSIDYIPFTPKKYVGYDADWEGGLEEAIEKFKNNHQYCITKSTTPESFNPTNEVFDYSIALEALEHLPSKTLQLYLQKLAIATGSYGFFSIPNEVGLVFFFKFILKKNFNSAGQQYKVKEVWYTLIGKVNKVECKDTTHKGFDYRAFLKILSIHYSIVEVKGVPFTFLPPSLNFTIGIALKRKIK